MPAEDLKLEEDAPPAAVPGDFGKAVDDAIRREAAGGSDPNPTGSGLSPDTPGAAPGAAPADPVKDLTKRRFELAKAIQATAYAAMHNRTTARPLFSDRELALIAKEKRGLPKPCEKGECEKCQSCRKKLLDRAADWRKAEFAAKKRELEGEVAEKKAADVAQAVIEAKGHEPWEFWNEVLDFGEGAAAFVGMKLEVPKAARFTPDEIAKLTKPTRELLRDYPTFAAWVIAARPSELSFLMAIGAVVGPKVIAVASELQELAEKSDGKTIDVKGEVVR